MTAAPDYDHLLNSLHPRGTFALFKYGAEAVALESAPTREALREILRTPSVGTTTPGSTTQVVEGPHHLLDDIDRLLRKNSAARPADCATLISRWTGSINTIAYIHVDHRGVAEIVPVGTKRALALQLTLRRLINSLKRAATASDENRDHHPAWLCLAPHQLYLDPSYGPQIVHGSGSDLVAVADRLFLLNTTLREIVAVGTVVEGIRVERVSWSRHPRSVFTLEVDLVLPRGCLRREDLWRDPALSSIEFRHLRDHDFCGLSREQSVELLGRAHVASGQSHACS